MRERTVHVLGAGPWQLPTLRRAKALGYRVLVTDGAAVRPGYAIADAHEVVDISDPEATLEFARRHKVDGVVCDTTDAGVVSAAYAAEQLGLVGIGPDVARRFKDKAAMREACAAAGVPQPDFRRVSSSHELSRAIDELDGPLIIKPADNMAGAAVVTLDPTASEQLFEEALAASKSGTVVVEEKMQGTECTVEGFVIEGKATVLAVSDKAHFSHRPTVAHCIRFPADISAAARERIDEVNQQVVSALGLKTGITHAEYFVDGDSVRLVEIAARGGGSEIFTHAVPHHTGVDLLDIHLRHCMGEGFDTPTIATERPAVHIEFLSLPGGEICDIDGVDQARASNGVVSLFFDLEVGAGAPSIQSDRDRKVHVVAVGEDRTEARKRATAALAKLRVEVT